ncbi:MAG: Tyrosine phosphatase family protein [Gemmataceae bacterium]|nr:Tyrosine phosphatase family protein [Gemmataceae bacterium]
MKRTWRKFLGAVVVALVVAVPLLYSAHRQTHLRNFRVVEDGVLYRSGQLSPAGFERVLHDYQIKTVVTLRTVRQSGAPYPDEWEKTTCAARGLNHVRIIPRVWGPDEKGEIPAEEAVREFLRVMDDRSNYPVLVHCFAGIHRTGTMCAIFRMEFHHWPADRAIAEMQTCGFDPADMHEHIEGYLRGYSPRVARTDPHGPRD